MGKFILWLLLNIMFANEAKAHEGHNHGVTPAISTSLSSLDLATSIQSPLTFSLKTRAGFGDGQFLSIHPGLFSYFGDDQINAALSYEFQYRQYTALSDQNNHKEYENNHRITVNISKDIIEDYKFILAGDAEQNRANTRNREANNCNSLSISGGVSKLVSDQLLMSFKYQYATKNYPNGTYSIPMDRHTKMGEPIVPTNNISQNDEVLKIGVDDAEHSFIAIGSLNVGSRTMSFESGYILHFSNTNTRQFTGQTLKVSLDSPLWKRATLQIAQGIEFRRYELEKQDIQVSELTLLHEISSKISATGSARYSQVRFLSARNWWEGYVQLQTVF